eukprot:CAMPEP_0114144076 /NCGR_PEP_ID=MMETSP0043_2-20121206/19318_1 /TAXON_ID=464988 /ORGANISM="Hemiselmis andersenii, Strain CCMP644" /LENGTH=120 /DNA_ID=CAMNT_0001238399 /DNA_START=1 /DNA_END=359 /DNA_ORIENTATION=+
MVLWFRKDVDVPAWFCQMLEEVLQACHASKLSQEDLEMKLLDLTEVKNFFPKTQQPLEKDKDVGVFLSSGCAPEWRHTTRTCENDFVEVAVRGSGLKKIKTEDHEKAKLTLQINACDVGL